MIRPCLVLLAVGCGGTPNNDGPADARAPAADARAPGADVATADVAIADALVPADAPAADASPDAMVDAVIVVPDGCPHRTVSPGLPQHPYEPSEIYAGSVTISKPADLSVLAGIKWITGDLTITGTVTTVSLPELEVVTGQLQATGDGLDRLQLPRLETVGIELTAHRTPGFSELSSIELPGLESLPSMALYTHAGDFACLQSAGVALVGVRGTALALPKLVTGNVNVVRFEATTLDVPALQHGTIRIDSGALTTLHAGSPDILGIQDAPNLVTVTLQSAANITEFFATNSKLADVDFLAGATKLTSFGLSELPQLHSIAGLASSPLTALSIVHAPLLVDFSPVSDKTFSTTLWLFSTGATQMAFPNATTIEEALRIVDHPALTSLTMPNLTRLGSGGSRSFISSNPMLPTCQATAIRDHVTLVLDSTFAISGNLPDSCSTLAASRGRGRGQAR